MPRRPLNFRRRLAAVVLAIPLSANAAEMQAIVKDGNGQAVADAVVYATPTGGARKKPGKGVMDQRNKEFMPHVLPVQVGSVVAFPNSDNIRHHVYSFSPAKKFELPLYKGTPSQPVLFDKPGPVALGCNIHDWMRGYIYVVDTPYFAKTDGDGDARLALPPGRYQVRAWHPRLDGTVEATTQKLAVTEKNAARLEFALKLLPAPPQKQVHHHDNDSY